MLLIHNETLGRHLSHNRNIVQVLNALRLNALGMTTLEVDFLLRINGGNSSAMANSCLT
jgi:hypothetical protein